MFLIFFKETWKTRFFEAVLYCVSIQWSGVGISASAERLGASKGAIKCHLTWNMSLHYLVKYWFITMARCELYDVSLQRSGVGIPASAERPGARKAAIKCRLTWNMSLHYLVNCIFSAYNDRVLGFLRQPNVLELVKERSRTLWNNTQLKNKITLISADGIPRLEQFANDVDLILLLRWIFNALHFNTLTVDITVIPSGVTTFCGQGKFGRGKDTDKQLSTEGSQFCCGQRNFGGDTN